MLNRLFTPPLISNRGFLPELDPIQSLPELSDLHRELNNIFAKLPELVQSKQLRAAIDALNVKYPDSLIHIDKQHPGYSKGQTPAAIFILTMLAQAYIWETPAAPSSQVPAIVGHSLYLLCKSKGRYPALTYQDYILQNWRRIDADKGITLENIEPIATFTGLVSEQWFIKIHVVIESICAEAMLALNIACSLSNEAGDETNKLADSLHCITTSLGKAIDVLRRMDEHCDPDAFWDTLRPYLGGSEKVKHVNDKGVEETGITLEGVKTRDKVSTFSFKGPSGAESSILPALDSAFKVKHDVDGMMQHLLAFQQYMPKHHRAYVGLVGKNKIKKVSLGPQSDALKQAYTDAVDQLTAFRKAHMGLVHRFIFAPAGARGTPRSAIVGTGGAEIDHYLGGRIATTHAHSLCK